MGEYSHIEDYFYLTILRPFACGKNGNAKNGTFIIKSTKKFWKINFCTILNNIYYGVVISQKYISTNNHFNQKYSQILFTKYTNEKFINQESIPGDLIYCAYNQNDTI